MPSKLSPVERGKRWASKHVKERNLYPVMNKALIRLEEPAYTPTEFARKEFYRGVYINTRTRIQNNMKRKEVIV